ncbi:MAG: hypothetical protein ABW198_03545 [Pseudorhodoplanes sp.]|jgi:hypothetical protein
MKLFRTVLIAASLVTVAASAQAQVLTGINGEAASPYAPPFGPQSGYSEQARGAFAQHPTRVHRPHR